MSNALYAEEKALGILGTMEFLRNDICSFSLRKLKSHHPETYRHSIRTANLCTRLYDALKLDPAGRDRMIRSALMHDIGKLSVDPRLLDQLDLLTHEEWLRLKDHCPSGLEIARQTGILPYIQEDVILFHHENLDGTGYFGLKGDQLSLEVRIVRAADCLDTMTGFRAYGRTGDAREVFEEMYHWRDIHFDPAVLDALHRLIRPLLAKEGADDGLHPIGE
ncbi:HD-GYP domain-containing protein [Cohnella caldifontis]|uniref:HD-GYP domain-containing protein n=1 Tax=Cohnella caldifontis TaxID=3027471 RepID=UPI0023ED7B8C|nr:HD domain-containing phosphohydrolase [Cohnella sp. YIM B05605]